MGGVYIKQLFIVENKGVVVNKGVLVEDSGSNQVNRSGRYVAKRNKFHQEPAFLIRFPLSCFTNAVQ